MGRPRSTPPPDKPNIEDDEEGTEINEMLKGIGGADVTVKIYKYDRFNKQTFLDDLPVESVQSGSVEKFIRDEYGGGSYLIRVVRGGKFFKGGSKVIHIADTMDGEPAAVYAQDPTGGNMQLKMLEMQLSMQRDSADRQFAMMQTFNQSMMSLMATIVSANKGIDPLQLAQLIKGDGSGVEMFTKAITVVKELMPEGGGKTAEDPTTAAIMTFGPKVLEILSAGMAGRQAQQLIPAQIVNNPPAKTEPAAEAPAKADKSEMEKRLEFLALLKQKAAEKSNPEFWADYIFENEKDAGPAWLIVAVGQWEFETIFESLSGADPELPAHKEWFAELYKAVKAELDGETTT